MRSFGSDNHSGVHPAILESVSRANFNHASAYGNDPWTERALLRFKTIFGEDSETLFTLTGTGANVLALSPLLRSYQSVLTAGFAHVAFDECGSLETFSGSKIVPIDCEHAKLNPRALEVPLDRLGDVHAAQPKVVSITQPTEYGVLYRPEEIKTLADFCHARGLYLHMDGARISNACAALGLNLREATRDLGVDVLSFGGTKNGLLLGEAVIFFHASLADEARFYRKKAAQLASKMRFIAAQFEAYLENDLWLKSATHANAMARRLVEGINSLPAVTLSRPADCNMIFATAERSIVNSLQSNFAFYVIDERKNEFRLVTSFDTTVDDISGFLSKAKSL